MDERRLRLDFVIAFCALLISTVAAVATVYQTHVIARQFSATVWPYVSSERTNSPWSFELDLRNDGLGPAIVRTVGITFDGKPQPSIEAVVGAILAREPQAQAVARAALRAGAKLRLTTSTPTSGMVIPANTRHVVVDAEGAVMVRYFEPAFDRVGLTLCYCSLTGTCWTENLRAGSEPKQVASCAHS
jgi:hypothetical protein